MSNKPLVARVPHGAYGRPEAPTQTAEAALAAAAIELRKQLWDGGIPEPLVSSLVLEWWTAKLRQR